MLNFSIDARPHVFISAVGVAMFYAAYLWILVTIAYSLVRDRTRNEIGIWQIVCVGMILGVLAVPVILATWELARWVLTRASQRI